MRISYRVEIDIVVAGGFFFGTIGYGMAEVAKVKYLEGKMKERELGLPGTFGPSQTGHE